MGPPILQIANGGTMARIRYWADIEKLKAAGELSPTEQKLIDHCKAGTLCALGDGTRPDVATPDTTISADLLRYLILGGCEECKVDELGVRLQGGYIDGLLDLSFAKAKGQTYLANCHFCHKIEAEKARFQRLQLSGSKVPGLNAQSAKVQGGLFLNHRFQATGIVSLAGAKVGGQLECSRGEFDGGEIPLAHGCKARGVSLNAQNVSVTGHVFLNGNFRATGTVRLAGAKIGGQLDCSGGQFDGGETTYPDGSKASGEALNVDSAEVTGGVFLNGNFRAKGMVRLAGAKIGGALECSGGQFDGGETTSADGKKTRSDALNAERAEVSGAVFLKDNFRATGLVRLAHMKIGVALECGGGQFDGCEATSADGSKKWGDALNAQALKVAGSVFLTSKFRATGKVQLAYAVIGTQLVCSGGQFDGGETTSTDGSKSWGGALHAQGMTVGTLLWTGVSVSGGSPCLATVSRCGFAAVELPAAAH